MQIVTIAGLVGRITRSFAAIFMFRLAGCAPDRLDNTALLKNIMPTYSTTLAEAWNDQALTSVQVLHMLMGLDMALTPKVELTPMVLANILNKVLTKTYVASEFFSFGSARPWALSSKPPALAKGTKYTLFSLNALTARGKFVSVGMGGIAFEHPVWAVLVADAVLRNLGLGVPIAGNDDELWGRLAMVQLSLQRNTYNPSEFLGSIIGFYPLGTGPVFGLMPVDSDQVAALRGQGRQALRGTTSPKFFEAYVSKSIADKEKQK